MSVLYNRIMELCEKRQITGYRLCKDIKISPNVITELRMGRKKGVSAKTADKIANYFGVTVGYLLGTEMKEKRISAAKTGDALEFTEDEINLIFCYRMASEDDKCVVDMALKKYRKNPEKSERSAG